MKSIDPGQAQTLVREDGVGMTEFFSPAWTGGKVTMGHATFPPGTVVPWAAHDCDEYSFILEGEVSCQTQEEGLCHLSAGGASFIPAGQRHSSRNDSDQPAQVLWFLVGKD